MKQDRHNAFRVVKLTGEVSEAVFNEAKHNLISEEHPKLGPWSWSSDTGLFIRAENSSGNGMVPCVMKAVVMQLFWLFVEDKSRWFSIPSATSNGIHLLWFPTPQAPFPLSSSSCFFLEHTCWKPVWWISQAKRMPSKSAKKLFLLTQWFCVHLVWVKT